MISDKEDFETRLALIAHQSGPKSKVVSLRLSVEQRDAIQDNADTYTDGNISEWLLIAGIDYIPWGEG